jgi:DNA-binding response OmpR family regulator
MFMVVKKSVKKILVIEDEKPLARALELKLVHEGFEVNTALNGELALEYLKKEKFSLIICDLILPKIDGFEILEFIKSNKIKTPVIILTNLSQAEDEKRVLDLGASNFFIKSNTPIAKIVEHIKKMIA